MMRRRSRGSDPCRGHGGQNLRKVTEHARVDERGYVAKHQLAREPNGNVDDPVSGRP